MADRHGDRPFDTGGDAMSRPAVMPGISESTPKKTTERRITERRTMIADTAIYQQTVLMAEKYKAQRDELYAYLRDIAAHHEEQRVLWESDESYLARYHEDRRNAALFHIRLVEKSL